MSDIFRFHTIRGVEELPKTELDRLSLPTHPEDNQSEWYTMLERLCQLQDFNGIMKAILNFLKSENAIHSIKQLDKDFQPVFNFVERKGAITTEKDKTQLLKLVDLRRFPDFFREKKIEVTDACGTAQTISISTFNQELQKVNDTQLSLAILGKLGHKDNLNYTLLFKVFHLVKLLFEKKKEVSLAEITQLFDKTTALPACFFKLNPCSKKLAPVQIESPFSHLGMLDFNTSSDQPQKLQIKGSDYAMHDVRVLGNVHDDFHVYTHTSNHIKDCNCDGNDANCECCECECDESCKDQNTSCATITPFITDLMVVREELYCYKAQHLAYVETIMLGEERERVHRHLERTEAYSEKETTVSTSEEKDHQVSERFNLQTETKKTLESDLSIDAGVTANIWGAGYKVKSSLDVASRNSKSEASRVAREQAVDITERTVRKIQETARSLASKKRIVETEETNTHIFKNNTDSSTKHINGMYQFINAEYKGQVMNYGKRMMFEFILPEPLEMYKKLMSKQISKFEFDKLEEPKFNAKDITISNYQDLLKQYNAEYIPPPLLRKSFSKVHSIPLNAEIDYHNYGIMLDLDEDYIGIEYKCSVNMSAGSRRYVNVFIDSEPSLSFVSTTVKTQVVAPSNRVSRISIPINVRSYSSGNFTVSVEVLCELSPEALSKWQISVYNNILNAYQENFNQYKAELARYNAEKAQKTKFGRNSFLNRETERTELKRMAISYISCQFYDQFTAMKRNVKPCGYPQMDLKQAEKDGKFIQFFEQLFDWNLMTYLFYPYFWGQKCSWPNKIQEDSGDPLFDKALMAGAARVQVPVKSGHEPLAIHWITFGEIWGGTGQPPVPGSAYYISMSQEIKEQKGVFNADREGVLEANDGSDIVHLTGSSYYWDFSTNTVDQLKIDNDIDREIFIDCVVYRIVSITKAGAPTDTDMWDIQLERTYETTFDTLNPQNMKWSTGALFVGAVFPITIPTNLVYLKNKKVDGEYVTEDCLPCFPQPKCE